PRIDAAGFSIVIDVDSQLQKLEPLTIRLETQQDGRYEDAQVDVGRYLKSQFDPERAQELHIESTLKFDLGAGERVFAQERDAIHREAQQRTQGKDATAAAKARAQLLFERIAALREENVKAGADRRGKATLHAPPLPHQALKFEKPEVLERLLKE